MFAKLICVFFAVSLTACTGLPGLRRPRLEREVMWNLYSGEIPGYFVEVSEVIHESGRVLRTTHLYPIEARNKGCSWCGISGHDYDYRYEGDYDWDRISRCGWPTYSNGCNAVRFTPRGRVWESSKGDKDTLVPFSDEIVAELVSKLREAMATVYNTKHLVSVMPDWDFKLRPR